MSWATFLSTWGSIILALCLVTLYATVWLIQIISPETIIAACRIVVRGKLNIVTRAEGRAQRLHPPVAARLDHKEKMHAKMKPSEMSFP